MHNYIALSLLGLGALVVLQIASIIVTRIQNASKARQLQCQPAPTVPNGGFLGLRHMRDIKEHDENGHFLDYWLNLTRKMASESNPNLATYKLRLLGGDRVFTAEPKNIQAMLATQFQDYDLGEVRHQIMGKVLGDGIFVQDGKKWEHSRAMLRPNFAREQVADLDLEERHVQEMFHTMPIQQDGWTDLVNIQLLFFRLTIDSATEFLFGQSCGSQLAGFDAATGKTNDQKDSFSQHFDSVQSGMTGKFRYDKYHWMHNPAGYKEDTRVVNEFVEHYVKLALQRKDVPKTAEPGHKEKYVFLEALAEKTRDPVELRAQLLNILLAGRDTTASLLSWTFDQLLRHPDVFAKLRSAVIRDFGTYDNTSDISFATLKSCQYLQHTLNEVLRLWTVVPANGRRTNKATTLPLGGGPDGKSPIFIPKGTQIDYSIHVMHRRKDLWGEDADEFKPERWQGRRPGWDYLPFNGGPRICIGQQFALTEASYVIVRLLQRFDRIEAAPGLLDGPILSSITLTCAPRRNVTMRLHQATA